MAGMTTKVIVTGVTRYKFAQEGTGEIIDGAKVHFVELEPEEGTDNKGYVTQQANLPYEVYEKLTVLPGVYDAELTIKLTGKKPSLKVTGFNLINAVEFKELPSPVKQH